MLEKGYSTSNPKLLNVELMDSTTCLDVDIPGRDSLKVFVRWYLLRHHRVQSSRPQGRPSNEARGAQVGGGVEVGRCQVVD